MILGTPGKICICNLIVRSDAIYLIDIQELVSQPDDDSGSTASQAAELTNCSTDWWYFRLDSNLQHAAFEAASSASWDTEA